MKNKRIIKPIAFVISVCVAALCCACSVEHDGDDISSSSTDYEQSLSEEDGSSESSSSL